MGKGELSRETLITDSIKKGDLIVFKTLEGRVRSGRVEEVTISPIQKMSHVTIHMFGSRETFVIFGSMLERDPDMIMECYDPASEMKTGLFWIMGES